MPFTASSLRNYLAGGCNLIIYLNVCPLSLKEMKFFFFLKQWTLWGVVWWWIRLWSLNTHIGGHTRTHTHTHPWSKKSRSSNLLTDMPVKGKTLMSRSYKNPWECRTSGIFALGLGRDGQRPRYRMVSMKIRSSDFFVEYKPLKGKKKPKSWPFSPKKFIVYLSCLNITLCPISQPSSFWVRTYPNFEGWYLCLFLSSSLFLFY